MARLRPTCTRCWHPTSGRLSPATLDHKACLRLQGDVSLADSGGFIQAALDIGATAAADASPYDGLLLEVYGNDQAYNVHLRPADHAAIAFHSVAQWLGHPFYDRTTGGSMSTTARPARVGTRG